MSAYNTGLQDLLSGRPQSSSPRVYNTGIEDVLRGSRSQASIAFQAKDPNTGNATAMTSISMITQAYGTIMEGEQKAAAYNYNAYQAGQDVESIKRKGEFDLDRSKDEGRMLLARQVAISAATGRSFSGSVLDVMARSERRSLEEQNNIQHNMLLAVANKENEAAFARTEAKIATRNAYVGAFTQLMGAGFKASAK